MARIPITGQARKAVSRNSITAPEPNRKGKEMAERNLLKEIRDFFGMKASDMIREWKELSETDKEQIRTGIENGTLTY